MGIPPIVEKALSGYPKQFLNRLLLSGHIIRTEDDLLGLEGFYAKHNLQLRLYTVDIQMYRRVFPFYSQNPSLHDINATHPIIDLLAQVQECFPFHESILDPSLSYNRAVFELKRELSEKPIDWQPPKRNHVLTEEKSRQMKKPRIEFTDYEVSDQNFQQYLKVTQMLRTAQKELATDKTDPNKLAYVQKLEKRFDELTERFSTQSSVVCSTL